MKKLTVLLLAASAFISSCMTRKAVQGSADYAKTHQTGNSAEDDANRLAYNIQLSAETPTGDPLEYMGNDMDPKEKKASPISFRAALGFISKGSKYSSSYDKATVSLNYLEVPITVMYSYYMENKSRVFAGIGPYFAYGIGGKVKSDGFNESSFGESNGGFKRFDVGGTVLVGYELGIGASINLAYEFGLANIAYASTDTKAYNRCISLNIGYSLDKLLSGKK